MQPGVTAGKSRHAGATGRLRLAPTDETRVPDNASTPRAPGQPLAAVGWMLVCALLVAVGNTMVRHVTMELHAFEVVFFRNLFSVLFVLPWLAAAGFGSLRTGRSRLYASRSLTSLLAMLAWFYSVAHMPLPEATALAFTVPLFVTIGGALFLGERVRLRRWMAVAIGFAGVLVIIRPGAASFSPATFVLMLHCVAAAVTTLQVRALAMKDSVLVVVAYMGLFLTPMALVPALFVWTWPSWTALGWLAVLSAVMTLAQLAMTRAFSLAPASAMMPYDYIRLPFTAVLAWLLFGEVMDAWGWAGAAVIAGSALYTAHRDARQNRVRKVREADVQASLPSSTAGSRPLP